MSFEERMDRITERQEALAQSLELLILQTRDFEAKVDSTRLEHEASIRELKVLATLQAETSTRVAATLDRLAGLAVNHEERLVDYKQRLDRLEGAA